MQRRDFLGALGVGAFGAAPHLTIDPGLDPAAAVARVRATGARSVRIGSAFNDYPPAAYKTAWHRIERSLREEGLGYVRLEWAFRPTGELVPFMDWHPGGDAAPCWRLADHADDPSSRSFLTEAAKTITA